jgi:hypothetical protein
MALRSYRIPTPSSSEPIATQRTTLSGQNYRLDFLWNERRQLWEMSIYDAADAPLAHGLALVHGYDLLFAVTANGRPPGSIILLANNEDASTLNSLGTDSLFYVVDEEVDS